MGPTNRAQDIGRRDRWESSSSSSSSLRSWTEVLWPWMLLATIFFWGLQRVQAMVVVGPHVRVLSRQAVHQIGRHQSRLSPSRFQHGPFSYHQISYSALSATRINENNSKISSDSSDSIPSQINTILEQHEYHGPPIQWYPGHIAKAERQLSETLKAVDVVVEVRDARIPQATAHPLVASWCAGKPRLVVLTHTDQVPNRALREWKAAYEGRGETASDDEIITSNDAEADKQVQNQAKQVRQERLRYESSVDRKKAQQEGFEDSTISPVQQVLLVNAQQGAGIHALKRAISQSGAYVQIRRERRGMQARSLRVGILGYPNVGKSTVLNRILNRKRARTANTPGVTRALQWIRVSSDLTSVTKDFEMLDSPGIIPAQRVPPQEAILLAACNCIGQAAYDNQAVAAYVSEWIQALWVRGHAPRTAPQWREKWMERYQFDPLERIVSSYDPVTTQDQEPIPRLRTGEELLFAVADSTCKGSPEDASRKILQDMRTGRMGPICLQVAPSLRDQPVEASPLLEQEDIDTEVSLADPWNRQSRGSISEQEIEAALALRREEEKLARAQEALQTAKAQGLELPPMIDDKAADEVKEDEVGKGLFDGW